MPTARASTRRLSVSIAVLFCGVLLVAWWKWPSSHISGDGARVCGTHDSSRESEATGQLGDRLPVDAAFDFLDAQMDRFHRSTIISSAPGFSAYYPSGKIGDVADISADQDRSSLRIDYRPTRSSGLGWAGIDFLYPDGNWGRFSGRNLSGATLLTFWVCADHDTYAEFSIGGILDFHLPYSDSLTRRSTGLVAVSTTWQRYGIDLKGADLSSVIGALAVATNRDKDARSRSIFLDDVTIDLPRLEEPRFVQSYVAEDCPDGGSRNSAQIYDQAVVLLAFLARGRPDDLRRAELIARALVEAQNKDRTFKDGRLRNAYASGELIDPQAGTTRIPGEYDRIAQTYLEDENAVGSDTGNMAWAALALVQAHALLPKRAGDPYLNAALSLARWIVANTAMDDPLGGFSAGMQGFERQAGIPEGQDRKNYRSTEHNIDLAALFEHLAAAVGRDSVEGQYWSAQMAHARSFVDKMRNDAAAAPYFWTGTGAGAAINKSVIPLDVQTWAVLGTREPASRAGALDWALKHCTEKASSDAFDFNCNDGDGAWWEGTAQVAAALRWLKRTQDTAPALARLEQAQTKAGRAAGAIPAASRCGLTTGFDFTFRSGKTLPWLYPDWPHIGATAWFIFAALGVNPYFVEDGLAGTRRHAQGN